MNNSKIFEELEKEKHPTFSTKKIGHYFIINLKCFPDWDTLLIRLSFMYRKYKFGVKK